MDCERLRPLIPAYADGELGVAEGLEIEAHLSRCRTCQALYEAQRGFRELIRDRAPRAKAPPELKGRIIRDMKGLGGRRFSPLWALPLIAIIAFIYLSFMRTPGVIRELVAQHAFYSQLARPAELSSSEAAQVAFWLKSNLPAFSRVAVPDLKHVGIQLLGGRLSQISERPLAYVLYQKDGALISLFALPKEGVFPSRGRDYYRREYKGFRVLLWDVGGMTYGLVSSVDWDELVRCARAVSKEAEI